MAFTGWKDNNVEMSPYEVEGPEASVEWRTGEATGDPAESGDPVTSVTILDGSTAEHVYEIGFGYIVVGGEIILPTVWSVSLIDTTGAHSRTLTDVCDVPTSATWTGC